MCIFLENWYDLSLGAESVSCKVCVVCEHCTRTSQLLYRYIQHVSWIFDITVGDNFLGLYNQKSSFQHGHCFQWFWCCGVFKPTPVNSMSLLYGVRYSLHDHQQPSMLPLKGGWCKHTPDLSLVFHMCCSWPVARIPCGLRWKFHKPALSTGHCELKAVSINKLSVIIKFIR